jgi:hypothetical protein
MNLLRDQIFHNETFDPVVFSETAGFCGFFMAKINLPCPPSYNGKPLDFTNFLVGVTAEQSTTGVVLGSTSI